PAPPVNQAPTVSAGSDQTITLPASASLTGTATDDGLPNPPGALSYSWTQVSGPGTVRSEEATVGDAQATLASSGIYVISLTASDSVLSSSSTMTITVNPAPPVNQAPTVSAGSDQSITLPVSANLTGTASDDGLPNPPSALSYSWTQVSGPGTV